MEIFGLNISKKKKEKIEVMNESPVTPFNHDGSALSSNSYYGLALDLDGNVKNENELIRKYREISLYSDCDSAVEDIINEAIVYNDDAIVEILINNNTVSEKVKTAIAEEFKTILTLMNFRVRAYDIFKSWYVDGRLYFNIIADEKNTKNGILELRQIEPLKIKKIKQITKNNKKGVDIVNKIEEFYLYNDKGINDTTANGVRLSVDSVACCNSGLVDSNTGLVLGYLHKAIKPVNQLKMLEDSVVIYRISRAPERRVFYIDVGNLPKAKAEQHMVDTMDKFRNKMVYDAHTGEVKSDKRNMSMMEDFWMPRRDGKSTEITTLPGAANLGSIEDVNYFQNKLFQSLNVPISRLKVDAAFSLGRTSEITRDEIKFNKFINRIRNKFSGIFLDILKVQLVLKNVMSEDDWHDIKNDIVFSYNQDNHFSEMKESELLQNRLTSLQALDAYAHTYFSPVWIKKNVLMQTEDEIKEIEKYNKAHKPPPVEGE